MEILNANCYVYGHFRKDTGVIFYIGIGSYQKKHKYGRMNSIHGRNIYWKRIVAKANGDYKKQILFDTLTKEEACLKEIELINQYGRVDLKTGTLCNLTEGGERGFKLTELSRQKISIKNSGKNSACFGKKQSEERKAKMSIMMSGEKNPNYGKKIPTWHKEINRKAQTGRKHSQETIESRVSKFRKKVIDIKNNITFNSIKDAAHYFDCSCQTITRMILSKKNNLIFE
jgi:hypothetical protein